MLALQISIYSGKSFYGTSPLWINKPQANQDKKATFSLNKSQGRKTASSAWSTVSTLASLFFSVQIKSFLRTTGGQTPYGA